MIYDTIRWAVISFVIGCILVASWCWALEGRNGKWRTVRDAWLAEHNTCAACGGKTHLAVHHIKPFHYYPELELDTTNFMTLCEKPGRNCHLWIGHSGDWKAWNPHAVEDAALMLKRKQERKYER
jgi:hypothetical protein